MKYRYESLIDQSDLELPGKIDGEVAIVAASWERRSQASLTVLKSTSIKKLVVVRFENHGKSGVSGNIRNAYKAFCKEKRIEHIEVIFDSVSMDYKGLADAAKSIDSAIGTGRKVIVDITSCPRLLWSSLVGLWDARNSIRSIDFLYARPKYKFIESPAKELIFDYTQGDWNLVNPAFLPELFESGLFKSNIISIGYEYDNIKRLLYKFEADDNIFVYSNPGFEAEYTKLAVKTVRKIRSIFETSESKFLPFAVNDFVGIRAAVNERIASLQRLPGNSVTLVCAGSKIHSLALLFCALENKGVNLRVRIPTRYNEISTDWAAKKFEVIRVENTFCPI